MGNSRETVAWLANLSRREHGNGAPTTCQTYCLLTMMCGTRASTMAERCLTFRQTLFGPRDDAHPPGTRPWLGGLRPSSLSALSGEL